MHPPSTLSPASAPPPRRRVVVLLAVLLLAVPLAVELVPRTAEAQSFCGPNTHQPGTDPEVLVLTTPTRLPQLCGRRGVEIFNTGPNPIYCAVSNVSTHARVGRARPIASGAAWSIDATESQPIYCVAAMASQVQSAATIVSEVR